MENKNENPGELNGSQVQGQQSPVYSVKSIKDLKSLAKGKDPEAMFELGHRYRVGIGCQSNTTESDTWFKKAVDYGFDIDTHYARDRRDERFDSVLRLYKNHIDDHHWGIQVFDKPQDAWNVVKDEWTESTFDCNGGIFILDDAEFEKVIFSRAVISLCQTHFGIITKDDCNLNLGTNGEINDFLVDNYNFFLYSGRDGRYYTSLMTIKDDYNAVWSSRQWSVYEELWKIYDFDSIVKEAKMLFKTYEYEIDQNGSEDYGDFLYNQCGLYYIP